MIFILMEMLEVLLYIWIIVMQFPVLSAEIELGRMSVVSNLWVYNVILEVKGIWEGN